MSCQKAAMVRTNAASHIGNCGDSPDYRGVALRCEVEL
jgi:hypothetical protein